MKRNTSIDFFRLIAAFLVICIHFPFPEHISYYLVPITRVAVPFFLVVTGFYLGDIENSGEKIKKHIVRVLKVSVFACFFYFFYELVWATYSGSTMQYLSDIASAKSIGCFVFLNSVPFASHLWYFFAMLYALVFLLFISKLNNIGDKVYLLIPVLLLIDLVFGKYSILLINRNIPYILVRNFLFVGIPYMLLGNYLSRHSEKILQRLTNTTLIILMMVFSVTSIAEKLLLDSLGANAIRDHYLSTTFLVSIIFFLLLKNPLCLSPKSVFVKIGAEYSLMIYLIHPALGRVVLFITKRILPDTVYSYSATSIVFLASVVFSFAFYKLVNVISIVRHTK